ncbi:MAG: glycosyltransferase family 2 protein [Planctomycetota bacterium]
MPTKTRCLTALPVYNEAKHVDGVLDSVALHADDVLVIDDGSTDGTSERLAQRLAQQPDLQVITHATNRGYGAALQTAFSEAAKRGYDVLVTIDCDGQHEPQLIGNLAEQCGRPCEGKADVVSGSRYLDPTAQARKLAPADRRRVNRTITAELNERLGLSITDAFCGFKAYRVAALRKLRLTEPGYAMPLELWVQAAHHRLTVREVAVPLIYLDEERSFGGSLDDARARLDYYRRVINQAAAALPATVENAVETAEDPAPCGLNAAFSW